MFLLNHFMSQTREFAHYQYYCIHRRSRLMHNREQKRDHSNTKSFFIENLSKNVIFRKNEIILTRSLSLLIEVRIRNFSSKIIRTRNLSSMKFVFEDVLVFEFNLIFASLLDRIEMIWRITIIVIFAFDRFELIELFAKIVASTRTIAFEVSLSTIFRIVWTSRSHRRILLSKRSNWDFDDIMIKVSCELVSLQKLS